MPPVEELTVETTAGPVRGMPHGDGRAWLGIPYAQPPIGRLRFRAPEPPDPWTDVRAATRYGAIAPQRVVSMLGITNETPQSEDCLTLNVFAPPGNETNLPVMVWIHGGAYALGASRQPAYDGRRLTSEGNVILVTLNYRLGAFGYLDLSSFSTADSPFDSNCALQDQILALRWVRDNIARFGGDPNKVTLFGQSAGGGAVTTLMTVPETKGLFQRAIAQSSPATSVYGPARTRRIAQRAIELAGHDPQQSNAADRLRELPTAELLHLSDVLYDDIPLNTPGTLAYAPVIDGSLVPEAPIDAFRAGRQHAVPLIIGTTRDEATLFRYMKSPLVPIESATLRGLFAEVHAEQPELPLPTERQLLSAYGGKDTLNARLHIAGDWGFRMPALWIAAAHATVAPTWMYRFDFATPTMRALGIGSTHATEVPLEFGRIVSRGNFTYTLGGKREARRISAQLMQRFTGFARDSTPGSDWPTWRPEDQRNLVFTNRTRVRDGIDDALWHAWGAEPIVLR